MDSFFFNITDTSYKISYLFENNEEYIKRVDISNGVVFYDILLDNEKIFHIKNLDRMIIIPLVKSGSLSLYDNMENNDYKVLENSTDMFVSSRQDLTFSFDSSKKTEIFMLFIADFILKRYLSANQKEMINYLYNKMQHEVTCELIDTKPIDALSLYIIDKALHLTTDETMASIKCEYYILEFLIHRLSLFNIVDDALSDDEICIASSAKNILLRCYTSPPSIKTLAHLCATNEFKLKKIFKKVHGMTIYAYVQKLRLERANVLLKEKYLNIGEIAKEVGYKHQGHFSKIFFEHYGVYPKDLLKN